MINGIGMNNKEKQSKYALLMKKLDIATKEEFYFEAILIEYAILEDRFASILKHANKNIPQGLQKKINTVLNCQFLNEEKIKKHLTKRLINDIEQWKSDRNEVIHNLIETTYNNKEIKDIALRGECLAKRLANKSTLINKYLDKMKE